MSFGRAIEKAILWVTAGVCIITSIAHLFGLMEGSSWWVSHSSTLTLLVVAVNLPLLIKVIEERIEGIQSNLNRLNQSSEHNIIDQVSTLRDRIDPSLYLAFGDYISDLLSRIELILRDRRIQFHEAESYRCFHRAMEKFPKGTFFVTTPLQQIYPCANKQTECGMARFAAGHGKIVIVFFLVDRAQLEDPKVQEILATHVRLGMTVHTAIYSEVPFHLRKIFVIESKERIGWELSLGPSQEIIEISVTSNPKATMKYVRDFKELLEIDSVQQYALARP